MSDDDDFSTSLPLFPLNDVVHFPRTEIKLQVSAPRYRRLIRDVCEQPDKEARRIGLVLIKPGAVETAEPEVFPEGTASRLVEAEFLPDGRSNVLLRGEYRFALEREVGSEPYRQGLVRPISEPLLDEQDAGIVAVRRRIVAVARSLAAELGSHFPLQDGELDALGGLQGSCAFEEMINRIAAELDLPALRKLQLLTESLPDRALSVLSILRSRQQVVDLLRPYRRFAEKSQLN
jgi:Lon protease-like protein